MNLELHRFHDFDGVRHLDYTPQVGDIVNVVRDITGIDKNGNAYKVSGSGFLSSNVVQIIDLGNDTITINDGTDHSPVVIVHAPLDSFEPANFINQKMFSPYTTTLNVANKVIKTTENVATGVTDFAENLTSGLGDKLKWIIIAAIVIGVIVLFSKLKSLT